jgi:hypothetical protein
MVATEVLEDDQVTELVKSWVAASLNDPMAENCSVAPAAMEGPAGDTPKDTRTGGPTVTPVEPVMLPEAALMFAVPTARAFAIPAVLIETVVGELELQVTADVMSCEVPSLYWPDALYCWVVPSGSDWLVGVTAIETKVAAGAALDAPEEPPPQPLMAVQTTVKHTASPKIQFHFGNVIKPSRSGRLHGRCEDFPPSSASHASRFSHPGGNPDSNLTTGRNCPGVLELPRFQ